MIQQQVKEIRFETVITEKIRSRALKTGKIREWLSLLKAYHEDNNFQSKQNTIHEMHYKFILNEEFWEKQLQRKLTHSTLTAEGVQFLFLAFDDGYYTKIAESLYGTLLSHLTNRQHIKEPLRVNFVIAKIQLLISIFKNSCNLYPPFRDYYKIVGNQRKVRELYLREIGSGYDDHDIVFDEYLKWQKNAEEIKKSEYVYQKGKNSWDLWDIKGRNQWRKFTSLDAEEFDEAFQLNFINKLQTQGEKLKHLRKVALKKHKLIFQFLQQLQIVHVEDDEIVIKYYQGLIETVNEDKDRHAISKNYLVFLVRRFNKHILQTQTEEYNKKWADSVSFFRKQIQQLINRQIETTQKKQKDLQYKQEYYLYWIDVETSITKDKEAVKQICQILLNFDRSIQVYRKYYESLIALGQYADARNVCKRACQAFQNSIQVYEMSQKFNNLYGTVLDEIQLNENKRKYIKIVEIQQRKQLAVINNQNQKQNQNIRQKDEQKKTIANGLKFSKQERKQIRKREILKRFDKVKTKAQEKKIQNEANHENAQISTQQSLNHQKIIQPRNPSILEEQMIEKHEQYPKQTKKDQQLLQIQQSQSIKQEKQQQVDKTLVRKKLYTDGGNTLFIKGIPKSWKQAEIRQIIFQKEHIQQIRLIQKSGQPQPYCYVQMDSPQNAHIEVLQNTNRNKYYIAISNPPSVCSQEKTLFLAGLPPTATVPKIKQLFGELNNQIVEVRLKLNENKNIAYVDFNTLENKNKAFQKYGHQTQLMDNRKIIIKQSNTKPTAKKEPNVIILKKLAFNAKQKDIVEFFKDFAIEDVYVAEQNGKAKGFAFVKFKKHEDFEQALKIGKGIIKGRPFEIQKSDRQISRPKINSNRNKDDRSVKVAEPEQNKDNNNYFSSLFK